MQSLARALPRRRREWRYILPDTPWPKTAEAVDKDTGLAVAKQKETRYGMLGKSERNWNTWGPWPPNSAGSSPVQTSPRYDVQPANRGDDPWKDWAKEIRDAQPECKAKSSSSSWHMPNGGANT